MSTASEGLTFVSRIFRAGSIRSLSVPGVLLAAWFGSAALASMVTTQSFTYSADVVLLDSAVTGTSGPTYQLLDGSTDPVMTVQPFTGTPSDLISFTIFFDLTYDIAHQNGPSGGSFSASAGGDITLDSVGASGNGNGTGNGGGPNDLVNGSFTISHSQTYLPSDAGSVYDPALLNLVLGTTPFELRFDHKPQISISGTDSYLMTLRGNSNFGMTYTAIPEPTTLFLFLAGAGLVVWRRRK